MSTVNSFGSKDTLTVGGTDYEVFRVDTVPGYEKLPFSLKVLLENLLRTEDGANVTKAQIEALGSWVPTAEPDTEIQFTPARVVMQDFTGVPCIVDLATMREAVGALGGDANKINPLAPAELVIDHSVIADLFGTENALERNVEIEYERNGERYQFLRWGQTAFDDFKVVPPGTGIVHQVNIEYLARVTFTRTVDGVLRAYPDTLVGTDSHTTMVNGLGVLGWGVGGIEAEAAMLGQPVSMLIPKVVGFKLTGAIPTGVTATDVVLTITQMLRKHGVVGKFVEFYGAGVAEVPLANRATIGNMSPEFGSTAAMFPIDQVTLDYLRMTGRERGADRAGRGVLQAAEALARPRRRADLQRVPRARPLDGRPVDRRPEAPAGPRRADRGQGAVREGPRRLRRLRPLLRRRRGRGHLPGIRPDRLHRAGRGHRARGAPRAREHGAGERLQADPRERSQDGTEYTLDHGAVAVAAITSCTNTSNPSVMIAAGLLARNANRKGLKSKPWVKTTLAPGSKVVTDYYDKSGLTDRARAARLLHRRLRLHGLHRQHRPADRRGLGRDQRQRPRGHRGALGQPQLRGPHQPRREDELPRQPAAGDRLRAGRLDELRLRGRRARPGHRRQRRLPARTSGRMPPRCRRPSTRRSRPRCSPRSTAQVFDGDERWRSLPTPDSEVFEWDANSTYVRKPPYFDGMTLETSPVVDIAGARVLAKLGDSVTTDHISPAGNIKADSPAGTYLQEHGVDRKDFNSYGSRRGNHEVMIRGTFANIRLKNQLARRASRAATPATSRRRMARSRSSTTRASNYQAAGTPLVIFAGKEYGSGSSRDWAAKGTNLLGVNAVIAESFERIHRSNLIGMGVIPLQFPAGETADSLGLDGTEVVSISGIDGAQRRLDAEDGARDGDPERALGARQGADRVRRGRAHRHPRRGRLLPQRRHPPVRAEEPASRLERDVVARGDPRRLADLDALSSASS